MLAPRLYPSDKFEAAWKNVLLYSEHTWGAHCSISRPASAFTAAQWSIKQSYATAANLQSRQLLGEAAQVGSGLEAAPSRASVDVYNTTSWSRTDLAVIPVEIARGFRSAVDEQGRSVPAQRLANHDLAVTRDAPLVQVGGITATLLNSQTDPTVWRKRIEPTQKLYSWAMNNHWGTNYRAYQEGPVEFRYVLRPHVGPCDDAAASRAAIGSSQPLVAVPGRGVAPSSSSLVRIEPDCVVVTGLKPSDDGRAIIVRLLGASNETVDAALTWRQPAPKGVWLSDTSERAKRRVDGRVTVPAWGVVALRAELR